MKISLRSDVGQVRSTNQDYTQYFTNQKEIPLLLLADGMGGHKAGDVASRLVVETLGEKWARVDFTTVASAEKWLVQEIQALNRAIYEKGLSEEFSGMGTTLEAVALFQGEFVIAHVGDSRSYLIRNGEISQLTEDHSLVNELFSVGEITEEEAENYPQKNIITRSIGMPGEVDVDVLEQPFVSGDFLLLCSDGLTSMVSVDEILEIVQTAGGMDEKVNELIRRANAYGGKDNITASLVLFENGENE